MIRIHLLIFQMNSPEMTASAKMTANSFMMVMNKDTWLEYHMMKKRHYNTDSFEYFYT